MTNSENRRELDPAALANLDDRQLAGLITQIAAAMGADCLLVAGGHQSTELLSKTRLPIFSNLLEVLSYLDEECES